MFTRNLRNAEHTRRFSIETTDSGWQVSEEQDSQVVTPYFHHYGSLAHLRLPIPQGCGGS